MKSTSRHSGVAGASRGAAAAAARRGYTLIEVLAVVAVVSATLGSVAVALQTMYGVDRRLRADALYEAVLPRLALQLRRDAHAARAAEVRGEEDGTTQLVLHAPPQRVEYRIESQARRVVRVVRDGEQLRQQEAYLFYDAEQMQWTIQDQPRPLVQLQLVRRVAEGQSADTLRRDRIEAVVGLHRGALPDDE